MKRLLPFLACLAALSAATACKQTRTGGEAKSRETAAPVIAPLRERVPTPGGFGIQGELYPVLKGGKFGYIDGTGKIVIEPQYVMASRFFEDLALVIVADKKKCGYINRDGKIEIEARFDSCGPFSEGLASIRMKNKSGVIDKKGEIVIDPRFDRVTRFHDGLAAAVVVREVQGLKAADGGYIDTKGNFVIAPQFDPNLTPFSEGVGGVRRLGQLWSFIDRNDKPVIAPKYFMVGQFSEGLAGVMDYRNRWGFIDKAGKEVIPPKYQSVDYFSDGLAGVFAVPPKKWGFVDKTGAMSIPPQFDRVQPFEDGVAFVQVGTKAGYINKEGKYVWPLTD